MQNKTNIDLSYILGTTLLHINKVSYGELLLIKRKMLSFNENYNIKLDEDEIMNTVDYWRDFFCIDLDRNILFTPSASKERDFVSLIFLDPLSDEVAIDLLKSINYVKKYREKGFYLVK